MFPLCFCSHTDVSSPVVTSENEGEGGRPLRDCYHRQDRDMRWWEEWRTVCSPCVFAQDNTVLRFLICVGTILVRQATSIGPVDPTGRKSVYAGVYWTIGQICLDGLQPYVRDEFAADVAPARPAGVLV